MNETLTPIDLTLTFTPSINGAIIRWESYPLGVRSSVFVSPYQGDDLLAVVHALDVRQYPSYPTPKTPEQERHFTFNEEEQSRLLALELWFQAGHVRTDAARTIGHALYEALSADPEGARALDTVRNHASASGQSLALHLRFPPSAIELASLPWELLWGTEPTPLLLSRGHLITCTRHLDLAEALPPPRASSGPLRIVAIVPHQRIPERTRSSEREARAAAWKP